MKRKTDKAIKRIRKLPLALGAVLVLTLAGAATAEWKVGDENSLSELKTANSKLSEMYTQQSLGTSKKSGEAVADPEQKIAKGDITLASGTERCSKANENQRATCEEIVRVENSQYLYMVKMFEITAKRKERLEELETERSGLNAATDYGKMQDNTNQLTALYTRMSLDRAQMESATFAYETRLRYLRQFQAEETKARMSGPKAGQGIPFFGDPASMGTQLITGAALKGGLELVKSPEPENYRKVGWL